MKKIAFLFFIFYAFFGNAQIVTIPDVAFKNALLAASTTVEVAQDINYNWIVVDTNNDQEIQNNEAEAVYHLSLNHLFIDNLNGIDAFTNLVSLNCNFNNITSINTSTLTNLKTLNAASNNLTSINVSGNAGLLYLDCGNNNLTNLV